MIAIIDYDIGNVSAVSNMLHRVGVSSQITSNSWGRVCKKNRS